MEKILILQTGGTLGQKPGTDGIYRPAKEDYLKKVPAIYELAKITAERTVNIDSTNMTTNQRIMLAKKIFDNQKKYDGFVIVHGTDTMAETACALSYMIQNLGKPIILTGSQISIFDEINDAKTNLYNAVKAATMDIGEVAIVFGDKIIRGNRSLKQNEHGFNAFESPRTPPIGDIGIDIRLNENRIKRSKGKTTLFTDFNTNVEFYQQSSGTNTKILEKIAEDAEVQGIVIGAYGAGNVEDRLIPAIKKATKLGKPVVVITTCQKGAADMGIYAVGAAPLEAGAISALDLTREAATQKLMYALGKTKNLTKIKQIIQTEITKDLTIH